MSDLSTPGGSTGSPTARNLVNIPPDIPKDFKPQRAARIEVFSSDAGAAVESENISTLLPCRSFAHDTLQLSAGEVPDYLQKTVEAARAAVTQTFGGAGALEFVQMDRMQSAGERFLHSNSVFTTFDVGDDSPENPRVYSCATVCVEKSAECAPVLRFSLNRKKELQRHAIQLGECVVFSGNLPTKFEFSRRRCRGRATLATFVFTARRCHAS